MNFEESSRRINVLIREADRQAILIRRVAAIRKNNVIQLIQLSLPRLCGGECNWETERPAQSQTC
jgi:hypothetical protein